MNLLGQNVGWMNKIVAAIVLTTLIASAFPASFFVANAAEEVPADVIAAIVIIDVCDNIPEVQTVVPEGYAADGSACYPIDPVEPATYTIAGHKYECTEGTEGLDCNTPVAGWEIIAQNGENQVTAVTDADGAYSLEVTAGDWQVYEENRNSWFQYSVWQDGYSAESYYCDFTFGEIMAARAAVATEADGYCDFGNVHVVYPVTGVKWSDTNSNGMQDEGETGVRGWRIYADNPEDDQDPLVAVTDDNGAYQFELENGNWIISEEEKSNWTQVAVVQTPAAEVSEGATTCEFSFGRELSKAKISEKIVIDFEGDAPTCDFYNHEEPRRGGGGSGTRVKDRPTPQVLGASTSIPSCDMYLHDYMRQGKEASSTEVTKLQVFLNAVGIKVEVTGMFDAATDAAVKAFQSQHKADVLTPWFKAGIVPHENPTGWVYQLTRWKINNIVCPGSEAYPSLDKS